MINFIFHFLERFTFILYTLYVHIKSVCAIVRQKATLFQRLPLKYVKRGKLSRVNVEILEYKLCPKGGIKGNSLRENIFSVIFDVD